MKSRLLTSVIALLAATSTHPAMAVDPATAIAAYRFFDNVNLTGGISCVFHLGANQCRRLDRCTEMLGLLRSMETGLPSAAARLQSRINSSGNVERCAYSLIGGNAGGVLSNVQTLADFFDQHRDRSDAIVRQEIPGHTVPTQPNHRGIRICNNTQLNQIFYNVGPAPQDTPQRHAVNSGYCNNFPNVAHGYISFDYNFVDGYQRKTYQLAVGTFVFENSGPASIDLRRGP